MKDENIQLRRAKEIAERQINNILSENTILSSKLQNLENVFVGSNITKHIDGTVSHEIEGNYTLSSVNYLNYLKLTLENNQLKKTLDKIQLDNAEMKDILSRKENPGKQLLKEDSDLKELKEVNIIFLNKRIIQTYKDESNFFKKENENYSRQS